MAMNKREVPDLPNEPSATTANFLLPTSETDINKPGNGSNGSGNSSGPASLNGPTAAEVGYNDKGLESALFSAKTRVIIWGLQTRAVQSMLDFDYVSRRSEPSVVAMVYPMTGDHKIKFYWGHKEILVPVYKNMSDAMKKCPKADVMISFASLRSAYESTLETLEYPQIRTIAIIAEGIPENMTRKVNKISSFERCNNYWPGNSWRNQTWLRQDW